MLTRIMESYEYYDLLRLANESDDHYVRMVYISLFLLSTWGGSSRMAKPFNPLLGETYEYYDAETNLKFFAEQTSHHPPISSCYFENDHFIVECDVSADSHFSLNSLELPISGFIIITLKRSKDVYYFDRSVTTLVHNLILGSMWVEHYGTIPINVMGSDVRAEINLKKAGFFGKGWNEVEGSVYDENNEVVYEMQGKYVESISVSRKRKTHQSGDQHFGRNHTRAWEAVTQRTICERLKKWKLDEWMERLLHIDDHIKPFLLESDSRLRRDRVLLEEGRTIDAGNAKIQLEQEQRERRAKLEEEGGGYSPRFFVVLYVNLT
jgi:hypothetical protein